MAMTKTRPTTLMTPKTIRPMMMHLFTTPPVGALACPNPTSPNRRGPACPVVQLDQLLHCSERPETISSFIYLFSFGEIYSYIAGPVGPAGPRPSTLPLPTHSRS